MNSLEIRPDGCKLRQNHDFVYLRPWTFGQGVGHLSEPLDICPQADGLKSARIIEWCQHQDSSKSLPLEICPSTEACVLD